MELFTILVSIICVVSIIINVCQFHRYNKKLKAIEIKHVIEIGKLKSKEWEVRQEDGDNKDKVALALGFKQFYQEPRWQGPNNGVIYKGWHLTWEQIVHHLKTPKIGQEWV